MANVIEKIANALDRVINGPKPNPFHRLAAEAFKLRPDLAPSAGQLAEVRRLAAEFKSAVKLLTDHDEASAKQKFFALHKTHSAAVRAGTLADVKIEGLDTLIAEYEAKRNLARAEMDKICIECGKVAKPVFEATARAMEAFIEERQQAERAEAASYGLEHSPSVILRAAQDMTTILNNRLRSDAFANTQPGSSLFFLDLN